MSKTTGGNLSQICHILIARFRYAFTATLLASLWLAIAPQTGNAQNAPIPPVFQDTYNALSAQITSFDQTVRAGWPGTKYPVNYAPELISANSDQYTMLLAYGYYNGVLSELMQLQALGAKTVSVQINFPVLYQPFYASNPSLYQSFVDFYAQLATDVHSRGMKLIVESAVGQPLAITLGGSFGLYYRSLSWNDYMNGRAQNIVNVAQLIGADYISVITEPDTEQSSSGQTNAGTVSGSTQLLGTILSALKTAGVNGPQIGAGAGTWSPSYTQFIQSFAATSINYVDTHVYPVNFSGLTNLLSGASIIRGVGKPMAISECWLSKVNDSEVGSIDENTLTARDTFSFWAPLDLQFLSALSDFSQSQQLLFLSPFWTWYFSAYLDYDVYGGQSNANIESAESQAAATAWVTGTFTSTGISWEGLTIPAPDTQAPAVPAAPTATTVGTTGVNLSWTPTTDNVGVASYNIYRNGALILTSNAMSYYDSGLTSGATYTYNVNAFDAPHNTSSSSPPLTVQTIDTIPPSTPTNLVVTKVTNKSVTLQWTRSVDNVGVKQYLILKGSSPNTLFINAQTNSDPFTDQRCFPNTTYYYAVKAQDARGNLSGESNVVSVTTTH